jgi:hypothetical protein
MRVLVLDVVGEHDFEVARSEDEHPVQALAPGVFGECHGEVPGLLGHPSAAGLAVTPAIRTRRVSWWMKKST